jgi:phosphoribosylformylglycinamidine synthase
MAVVTAAKDADALIAYAAAENLDAVVIAAVTAGDADGDSPFSFDNADSGPRLRMGWRGKAIVDLSRRFLNSNGAPRSAAVVIEDSGNQRHDESSDGPSCTLDGLERELGALRTGSRRGLQERFDGSIGAASALYPWGGAEQGTPECGMAALLPSLDDDNALKESLTASLMSFGYDPDLALRSPYDGAKGAIREALAKYACLGGNPWAARLSLQEYFERMDTPQSWGKPLAALLGALEAQLALDVPAIGGKDSMSGSYRDDANHIDLAVPPTLVAFAAGTAPAAAIRTGALSGKPGNAVILLYQGSGPNEWDVFKANMNALASLSAQGLVRAAYPVGPGGVGATLAIMAFGNMAGIAAEADALSLVSPGSRQGSVLVEAGEAALGHAALAGSQGPRWAIAARTLPEPVFRIVRDASKDPSDEKPLTALRRAYPAGPHGIGGAD